MLPLGIATADPAAECKRGRSGLHIERLVVFQRANRFDDVDLLRLHLHRLKQVVHLQGVEKLTGLAEIRPIGID